MNLDQVADIIYEYGNAVRNDWSDIDGRAVRNDLDLIADAVRMPQSITRESLRERLGLCATTEGSWEEGMYCACTPSDERDIV